VRDVVSAAKRAGERVMLCKPGASASAEESKAACPLYWRLRFRSQAKRKAVLTFRAVSAARSRRVGFTGSFNDKRGAAPETAYSSAGGEKL
jgi:hypothetical protein